LTVGGHVKIYSKPGEGKIVGIYLPPLAQKPGAGEVEALVAKGQREEIILVVEDDADVRAHSVGILRELGYGVLEAGDGPAALRLLERHPNVRLLLADVGLPGINGRELADAARRRHPRLKVLLTAGHARSAIVHDASPEPGLEVMRKPFAYAALAAKVREVLGSTAASRVLLVEDEAMVRMMVVQGLRDYGYEPEEAATAAEAVELVRASKRPFDAVIVDLGLPDRRGDALMEELRELVPDLPILIASGYDEAELEQRIRGKPRLATLSKPYDVASLHAALRVLLAEPPRSA
jgi:CheY-like chemotaxis protein